MAGKIIDKNRVIQILKYYKKIDKDIRYYKQIISDLQEPTDTPSSQRMNISHSTLTMLDLPEKVKSDIEEYLKKIENLQLLKAQIIKEVSRLDCRKKGIIFDYYIKDYKWERVAYQNNYSEAQCKNIRNEAIDDLIVYFVNNPVILESDE